MRLEGEPCDPAFVCWTSVSDATEDPDFGVLVLFALALWTLTSCDDTVVLFLVLCCIHFRRTFVAQLVAHRISVSVILRMGTAHHVQLFFVDL